MPFFFIFIFLPFLEIIGFMTMGQAIGLGSTLLLAFATAILGGSLVRHQRLQTLLSFRQTAAGGSLPSDEIFTGLCLVAAGALLITPGFVTDAVGFSLLVPQLRIMLKAFLSRRIQWAGAGGAHSNPRRPSSESSVLDIEFETVDPGSDEG